jgi:hypothetical protein
MSMMFLGVISQIKINSKNKIKVVLMMFLGVIFLAMPISIVGTIFSQTCFNREVIILVEKVRSRMRQQG